MQNPTILNMADALPYALTAPYFKKLLNRYCLRGQRNGCTHSTLTESDPNPRKPLNITNLLPTLTILYVLSAFINDEKKAVKRYNLDIYLVHAASPHLHKNPLDEPRPHDKVCKKLLNDTSVGTRHQHLPIHCSQTDIVFDQTWPLRKRRWCIHWWNKSTIIASVLRALYRPAANSTAKSYKTMTFSKHYYKARHEGQEPKLMEIDLFALL